jgi:hypothetical protein
MVFPRFLDTRDRLNGELLVPEHHEWFPEHALWEPGYILSPQTVSSAPIGHYLDTWQRSELENLLLVTCISSHAVTYRGVRSRAPRRDQARR